MKTIITLAITLLVIGTQSMFAQSGPDYATVETVLSALGVPYEHRDSINIGSAIGTLTQNAADPNPQYIVFNKGVGAKGNVKLRANYYYYQPFNTNFVYTQIVSSLGDPSGQGLYGSEGTQVIIDVTKTAQIRNDEALVKLYATDGHTYLLTPSYSYDGSNYYLVLTPTPH